MLFGSILKNYKQKQQGHKHLCIPLLLFCIGKNRVNYDIVRLQERGRLIVEERGETRDDGHITSDRSDPVQVPVQILVGGEDRKPVGDEFCGSCRVERMEYLTDNLQKHQIAAELEIIPGIGHSDGERVRTERFLGWLGKLMQK